MNTVTDTLERQVAERTGALAQVNRELQDEIAECKRAMEALRESEARHRRLFERGQAALAETQALYRVTRSVSAFENLPHALQTVVDAVAEALPANRVTLITFDLDTRQVTHFVKGGPGTSYVVHVSFDELWDGLSGWVLREMKPALSPKDVPDPREAPEVQRRRAETNCGAIIVVPLRYRDKTLGTITAINCPDERNFRQRDVKLMVSMANQAAIAIENARLHDAAQQEIAQRKEIQEALNRRLVALTEPLETADISFSDLFDVEEIQGIQDAFAEATHVASIITYPDGTPITRPSSFCRLCNDLIRKTEKGLENCFYSDAIIGRQNPTGPIIQLCLSGGLWDAGASITVGGKHIANWLIGQVKNEAIDEEKIIRYASEIGADEDEFRQALQEVPVMSNAQFQKVANALFLLANELSLKAYQNVQQARFITQRKQAEEALRLSEEKYRALVENVNDVIFSLDAQGSFTYISPAIERFAGYEADQVMGQPFARFVHPADLATLQTSFEQTLTGNLKPYEFRVFAQDGAVLHARTFNRPLWEDGQLVGLNGIMTDITERVRAESQRDAMLEALRESEERLRTLINGMPDIVCFKDGQGRWLEANAADLELFELQGVDYRGKKDSELAEFSSFYRDAFLACEGTDEEAWGVGSLSRGEEAIPCPGGAIKVFDVLKMPLFYPDGKRKGLIVLGRDITERKQAEEALRESEARLRALIDNLPVEFWAMDSSLRYIMQNAASSRIVGNVIGKRIEDLDAPTEVKARWIEQDRQVLDGKPLHEEYQIEVEGEHKAYENFLAPVRVGDTIVGLVGVAMDITARKQAEKRIEQEIERTKILLELYVKARDLTDLELYNFVLEKAAALTGSSIGFFHIVEDDQKTIRLTTWNRKALENCTAVYEAHYPVDRAGNWVDCVHLKKPVVYNDFPNSPNQKGLPEGHVPVRRFMSIPVMEGDRVRFIFGVGNKVEEYEEHDVMQIQVVANELHKIIIQRRAEEALRLDESRLKALLALNQMTEASIHEITDFCLEEGVRLTKSKLGYLAFMNEDETVLTMHSWSKEAMAQCAISDKPLVYPVATTGLWGEAVRQHKPIITNDYAAPNPLKKGYPPGHVRVTRHMNVPVFDGERIVAVAGVGNKEEDYDESDVRQLTLLTQGMWRLIQRRRAAEALVASETNYREIFNKANDAIFVHDIETGAILDVNQSMCEMYGYTPDQVRQINVGTLSADVPPYTQEDAIKWIKKAIGGKPQLFEWLARDKAGQLFWVEVNLKRARIGAQDRLLALVRDIGDRKQAEEELKKHREHLEDLVQERTAALEDANAELSQYTYVVSHDLRAPLRAIHNYADFLKEDLADTLDGDQKAYLDGLRRAVHEAGDMVEDLLKLSRLDRYDIRPETINLGAFLHELIASLHLPAEVEVVMGADWPTLDAEPALLRQIFQNLIDNAVKFNASPHKQVELGWRPAGKEAYAVFVRDNGIGIAPRHHEQIFRLFERLHTREEYEGTGVGLAIVKKAAGRLRGSVRVESEIGQGSTFFVTLPKAQKERGT